MGGRKSFLDLRSQPSQLDQLAMEGLLWYVRKTKASKTDKHHSVLHLWAINRKSAQNGHVSGREILSLYEITNIFAMLQYFCRIIFVAVQKLQAIIRDRTIYF